jgi:hypothetical protein
MTIEICVSNTSTLVSDADLATWCAAIQRQVNEHFSPVWGTPQVQIVMSAAPEVNAYRVILKDEPDDPNSLGFHLLDNGIPEARIFCRPTIDDGDTISSVLSHECLEFLADPLCTRMFGKYISEVADPVESTGYLIDGVVVSNFVLPSYFGLPAVVVNPVTRWDYNGQLSGPCPAMLPGGYVMSYENGNWQSTMARLPSGKFSHMQLRSGRAEFRASQGAPGT